MSDKVLVPVELTAENGAKAALMGEFSVSFPVHCPDCPDLTDMSLEADFCKTCRNTGQVTHNINVPWVTIKEIWKKAIEVVAAPEPVSAEPVAYMLPFGNGTFSFEKTLPDYVEDIQSSDWLPLYTHPPAQEWMPIETAPRDGSDFLGFERGYGIQKSWWDEDHDESGGFMCPHHGWSPTHWMPLPSPPE